MTASRSRAGPVSLTRALSKLGYCSRTQAAALIASGVVTVDGERCVDPMRWVDLSRVRIAVEDQPLDRAQACYIMLNKPRGLITTRSDEQGRETVFSCLTDPTLPHLTPVGRLDKASEGLLLLSNDTRWANGITAPESQLSKVYHVQIGVKADAATLDALHAGVDTKQGERLAAAQARVLREGSRNCWLEITLSEGRNRQIRRMLQVLDIEVLRLIRISIGSLQLGELPKGHWRALTADEVSALSAPVVSVARHAPVAPKESVPPSGQQS